MAGTAFQTEPAGGVGGGKGGGKSVAFKSGVRGGDEHGEAQTGRDRNPFASFRPNLPLFGLTESPARRPGSSQLDGGTSQAGGGVPTGRGHSGEAASGGGAASSGCSGAAAKRVRDAAQEEARARAVKRKTIEEVSSSLLTFFLFLANSCVSSDLVKRTALSS